MARGPEIVDRWTMRKNNAKGNWGDLRELCVRKPDLSSIKFSNESTHARRCQIVIGLVEGVEVTSIAADQECHCGIVPE